MVCRFFIEGRCKFGDNCRYEHGKDDDRDEAGLTSFWIASHNEYLKEKFVIIEKDIPSLPDFVDISPEEMRLDAYNANDTGKIDAYKQTIIDLRQEFFTKQEQFKNPSKALVQRLVKFLEEARHEKLSRESNLFSRDMSDCGFGNGAMQVAGKLSDGNSAANFGTAAADRHSAAVSLTAWTGFGDSGQTGHLAPPVGLFSNILVTSQHSRTDFIAPSMSTEIFGQTALPAKADSESSVNIENTFRQDPVSGTVVVPTFFGQMSTSVAGQDQGREGSSRGATGLQGVGALLVSTGRHTCSVYTDLSELTEDEMRQFKAPRFVLGKIPIRPPAKELIDI